MSQTSFTHPYLAPVAPIFAKSSPAGAHSATSGNIRALTSGSPSSVVRDSGISTFTPTTPSPISTGTLSYRHQTVGANHQSPPPANRRIFGRSYPSSANSTPPNAGGASNIERDGKNSVLCLPAPNLPTRACALLQLSPGGHPDACRAYPSNGVRGVISDGSSRVPRQASSTVIPHRNPTRLDDGGLTRGPSPPSNSSLAVCHSSFVNSNCGGHDLTGATEQHSISERTLVSQDDSHGSCPNFCSSLLGGCSSVGFSPRSRGKADYPVIVSKGRGSPQADKKLSEKISTRAKVTKQGSLQKTAASSPPDVRGDITSTSVGDGPEQMPGRQGPLGNAESSDEHGASCCGCGFLKWVKRLFTK